MDNDVKETFASHEINDAIRQFLKYGEESFVGDVEDKGFGHRGYFCGDGWPARCLRYHLDEFRKEDS